MAETYLETERLILRNWQEEDRDLFHLINSDETVMEFFPFRRDREASDAMMDEVRKGIAESGFGFTAIALKESGEAIGFCGLANAGLEKEMGENAIEIGWRLAPQFWGRGYITEAAVKLLEYGFEELKLDEIVSFAVHNNHRSFAVMERIGMTRRPELDFDHIRVPDTHPHLKRHLVYSISKQDFT